MAQVERKTVEITETLWKQPDLNEFILYVIGRFSQKFATEDVKDRGDKLERFEVQLKRLEEGETDTAAVTFKSGFKFAFVDYVDEVYFDEFDELVDIEGEKIEEPLKNELFFWVGVNHTSDETKSLREVREFFEKLKLEGHPIEGIDYEDKLDDDEKIFGEVYVYLDSHQFEEDIQMTEVEIDSPAQRVIDKAGERFKK